MRIELHEIETTIHQSDDGVVVHEQARVVVFEPDCPCDVVEGDVVACDDCGERVVFCRCMPGEG